MPETLRIFDLSMHLGFCPVTIAYKGKANQPVQQEK